MYDLSAFRAGVSEAKPKIQINSDQNARLRSLSLRHPVILFSSDRIKKSRCGFRSRVRFPFIFSDRSPSHNSSRSATDYVGHIRPIRTSLRNGRVLRRCKIPVNSLQHSAYTYLRLRLRYAPLRRLCANRERCCCPICGSGDRGRAATF